LYFLEGTHAVNKTLQSKDRAKVFFMSSVIFTKMNGIMAEIWPIC
jgi:hypothetical protein